MKAVSGDLTDPKARASYETLYDACPTAFVQQSADWAEVIGPIGPALPRFLVCLDGEDLVAGLPLYLYRGPGGAVLVSVPQAGPFGGILIRPDLPERARLEAYGVLVEAALEAARGEGCLALTVMTNPFAPDLALYETLLSPDFVLESYTQFLRLDAPAHRSHGHRSNLNRARKSGLAVSFSGDARELGEWLSIHRERHSALGLDPLPARLFENALHVLAPRDRARLLLVRKGERIVSGGFYMRHRDLVDVYMLSTSGEGMEMAANFLNSDHSMASFREAGARVYHWQSSPGRASGVYQYKKQWGSEERPYHFLTRLLVDRKKIQELGPEGVRRGYPGHFVVPFAAFEKGFDAKYFRKE